MADSEGVLRSFFEAISRQDFGAVDALLDDEFEIHAAGRSPFAGTLSKREWFALMPGMMAMTNGMLHADVHEVLGKEEHAVALLTMSAERNGCPFEWLRVNVAHVRDGRIVAMWIYEQDLYAYDAFWSADA